MVAERLARACQHERLCVGWVVGTAFDLGDGGLCVLRGKYDCRLEARFRFGEVFLLPVVDRGREGGGKFRVELALTGEAERPQHAVLDAVGVEVLRADQVQVRPWVAATVGPGVASARAWRRLG